MKNICKDCKFYIEELYGVSYSIPPLCSSPHIVRTIVVADPVKGNHVYSSIPSNKCSEQRKSWITKKRSLGTRILNFILCRLGMEPEPPIRMPIEGTCRASGIFWKPMHLFGNKGYRSNKV